MQIPGVGVEDAALLCRCARHGGMAVPDVWHIVVRIEKLPACLVVQVLHPPANDLQRRVVREIQVSPDDRVAMRQRF